ncbi:hypothetical protein BCR34DRAFT_664633 [Clohesyomyces aquaticus]|uniref:Uncharacterized protein n=1 Tax=Clohesyomyces aquaticus TaxID=1231657 RepID=A0A1Y1ZLD2_9PLEO|nr:hypothetical protein BCR34DRAFT_664633 [Clohesyomyces aquaticus]
MPTYHRRRPAPLILDIRQATTTSIESPDSPSPTGGPPSPDSPDLPSATTSSFPPSTTAAPAPSTAISASELQASSTPPSLSSTLITSQTPSSPTSSTSLAEPGRASSTPSPTPSTPVQASSTAVQSSAQVSSAPRVNVSSSSQAIEVTFSSGAIDVTSSVLATISSTAAPDARSSRIKATPPSPTTTVTSILSTPSSTALPDNDDNKGNEPPRKATQQSKSTMSKGAEAALITIAVLGKSHYLQLPQYNSNVSSSGALALVIALVVFLKRRRRRHESALRHAEDAFDPSNTGSLQHPEGVHHADIHTTSSGTGSHMTQSTMTSSALFAGDPDHRPETISTDPSRSRFQAIPAYAPSVASTIQTPMPSANPFADPPRNKAYDVLRGRPRSTTLTDPNRGSWVKNPFKDPVSERFDPFGELQERARNERVRYIEELRMEQEQLEKDRVAMSGGGLDGRKGSGVTVEGLGVLDRAGGGGGYRGVS